MKTKTKTTYRALTHAERKALPKTYGATQHANSRYISDFKIDSLEFDHIKQQLQAGFHIGLENYIDSASWRICDILKTSNNANKEAAMCQLALAATCGLDQREALKLWHGWTSDQQEEIETACIEYLESCLEYLQESF